MGERLFKHVTIHYTMKDRTNPETSVDRVINDVTDISQAIYQTAKSAYLVGMQIDSFTVKVEYES